MQRKSAPIRRLFNRSGNSQTAAAARAAAAFTAAEALETRRMFATVHIDGGDNLDAAISRAGDGGTVILGDGTYSGGVKVEQDGVTIEAENEGKAVVKGKNGQQLFVAKGGEDVTVRGIVFRGGGQESSDNTKAAVKTGSGWTVEDCVVEDTAGVGLGMFGSDVTVRNVIAQDNGRAGIGGSGTRDSRLLDSVSRRNNGDGESAFAGGGKFTRVDGLLVDGYESYENKGPGLWFDYININVTVRNSEIHNNKNSYRSNGKLAAGGTGLFFEISGIQVDNEGDQDISKSGKILVENNHFHDNAEQGLLVWGTQNVTIRDNEIEGNKKAQISLRGGRANPFQTKNIRVEGNDLSGKNTIEKQNSVSMAGGNNGDDDDDNDDE